MNARINILNICAMYYMCGMVPLVANNLVNIDDGRNLLGVTINGYTSAEKKLYEEKTRLFCQGGYTIICVL